MGLNPFKESNLEDLQNGLKEYISNVFGDVAVNLKEWWTFLWHKGKEKITVMFIPHSEKKIINFHISIFTIFILVSILATTITITSLIIINHTSTIKEVSKLKQYGTHSKQKIKQYRHEINNLYEIFQQFKPEVTYLYSLTPGNDVDSLWAKGGAHDPETTYEDTGISPPIEILNLEEVEREMKTTKKVLAKIMKFLSTRKKILDNTPSLWPAEGFIISQYGERTSPYNFKTEFHNGLDISAFPGSEIRATAPGRIKTIEWNPVLGLRIIIRHKYGFETSYAHCQRVSVEEGQEISKGEVIAYVGRTGKATRHICYYQIKIGTQYVDPVPFLNKLKK